MVWPFTGFQTAWPPAPSAPPPPHQAASPPSPPPTVSHELDPAALSRRHRRQLTLYFAGAGFFYMSVMATRRAAARKQIAAMPKLFDMSFRAPDAKPEAKDPLLALEALNLATVSTVSFFMMVTGGFAWAMDISNLDDLRALSRKYTKRYTGEIDRDEEKVLEEWAESLFGSAAKGKEGGGAEGPSNSGDESSGTPSTGGGGGK